MTTPMRANFNMFSRCISLNGDSRTTSTSLRRSFENHVGGAVNQIVAQTVCDGGERAHAARRDHHSQRHKRATGDRCALRADAVTLRREALYVFQRIWGFVCERACRPLAYDQMCFHSRSHATSAAVAHEDRSGRACDADDKAWASSVP